MQENAYRGMKTFQKLSLNYLHDISSKKDPLFARLIFNWPKIVHTSVSQNSEIIKLYTDSSQKRCLLLGCNGSHITLMQMKSGVILEKINLFLGKNYIQKIIFKATHIQQKAKTTKKNCSISPEKETEIKKELIKISDPEIKDLLIKLGIQIKNQTY